MPKTTFFVFSISPERAFVKAFDSTVVFSVSHGYNRTYKRTLRDFKRYLMTIHELISDEKAESTLEFKDSLSTTRPLSAIAEMTFAAVNLVVPYFPFAAVQRWIAAFFTLFSGSSNLQAERDKKILLLALRLLLEQGLISEDEYGRICRYNAAMFKQKRGIFSPIGYGLPPQILVVFG